MFMRYWWFLCCNVLRRANRCWHLYVVMCCDVRIDAGTKCWSSGKGDYHVGHVTGEEKGYTSASKNENVES